MLTAACSLSRATLLLTILALPVAAQSREGSDPRDVEAVKATMVAMWAAIEASDATLYATYVHQMFTQFGENDTYLAEGKVEEVRSIATYEQRAKQVHTVMHQPDVTVRGNVAWVTYYWTDEGMIEGKRLTSRGKSTRIFVREPAAGCAFMGTTPRCRSAWRHSRHNSIGRLTHRRFTGPSR